MPLPALNVGYPTVSRWTGRTVLQDRTTIGTHFQYVVANYAAERGQIHKPIADFLKVLTPEVSRQGILETGGDRGEVEVHHMAIASSFRTQVS